MKLRAKIMSGFLILVIMLALAGIFSIYELTTISSSVQSLLDDNYKSINAARTMTEALEREDSGVLLVLSGKWQKGRETIELGDDAFQKAFAVAQNNITISDEKKYVDGIASNYQKYKALWMEFLAGTMQEPDQDWYFEKMHGIFLATKKSVEELTVLNDETMYKTASGLHNRANRAIMPGIIAILSALVFVAVFNYFINYYVIKPLNTITQEVRNSIPRKELIKISVESHDELHDLAAAIQDFALARKTKA